MIMDDNTKNTLTREGRSYRNWTDEEIAFLKKHYVKKGRKFVAEHLQRTTTCVAGYARILGLKRLDHREWTSFEDNYIRRNFGKKLARSIARSLHRTLHAVHARASMLGLTKEKDPEYTPEERAFIKDLYEKGVSATKIAEHMGRPESSIRTRINRWGFKSSRPWSKREESFLKKNYSLMTIREIAEELGRTENSVTHYVYRHGLRRKSLKEESPEAVTPAQT
jgi:transposase